MHIYVTFATTNVMKKENVPKGEMYGLKGRANQIMHCEYSSLIKKSDTWNSTRPIPGFFLSIEKRWVNILSRT